MGILPGSGTVLPGAAGILPGSGALALAVSFPPTFPFVFSFLFLLHSCFSALYLGLEHCVLIPGEVAPVLPGL